MHGPTNLKIIILLLLLLVVVVVINDTRKETVRSSRDCD